MWHGVALAQSFCGLQSKPAETGGTRFLGKKRRYGNSPSIIAFPDDVQASRFLEEVATWDSRLWRTSEFGTHAKE